MARGAVLTNLLGVYLQVALIVKTPPGALGLPQSSRHVDSPEENNDAEFRPSSMGVSKVIDLNTGTIAYKDHILKSCYIEKISSQSAWEKDRMLIVHPKLLTNEQVSIIGGHIVANFCFGWPSRVLRLPTNFEVRSKRSNKQYYFVGRKARGQTQSQYLQFGNSDNPGKAEAEATRQGSKAVVYGSRGMGSAQSQSDPFSCADCYGYGAPGTIGSQTSTSPFAPGGQLAGGRQFDTSGRPIISTGGRPIGVVGTGDGGSNGRTQGTLSPTQTGQGYIPRRGSTTGEQTPGQLFYTPDGRIIHPGATGQTSAGTPGTSSFQTHPGQTGGPQGSTGGHGTGTHFIPGQTHPSQTGGYQQGGLLPGTTGGRPGTESIFTPGQAPGQTTVAGPGNGLVLGPGQTHPSQTGGLQYPGATGGATGVPSTSTYFTPGQQPGTFQTHPGQTTVGGQDGVLRPGQTHPSQAGGSQHVTTGGGPSTGTYFTPGQQPGTFQTHPGQTTVGSQDGVLRPGQTHPNQAGGSQHVTTNGIPGTGTHFTQVQTPGQAPGSFQIHPGQTGGVGGPGSTGTEQIAQLYDHGGIQKPSGRPTHPGDVGLITPGQGQQQPGGETRYFIPGGIRPRPGDGSFGYYPSTSAPGGRIHGSDSGVHDGTFNGQVAGQYRPASGQGGDFSGTFQGRYSPHGSPTQAGGTQSFQGAGGEQQVHYPGTITGSSGQGFPGQQQYSGEQIGGRWPQLPGTTGEQIPGQYVQGPGTQGTYIPGQTHIPSGSQTTDSGYRPGYQQGTGLAPGQTHITTGSQYPVSGSGQPGYPQGTGHIPGQLHTTTGGQYPGSPTGQTGYQQGTGLSPGQLQTSTNGQYPGSGQPGYQQGTGLAPGLVHTTTGGQYPASQPGYQQGTGLTPGQPGYQQGTGLAPGQMHTITGGQYPAGPPGYQQSTVHTPGQVHTTTGGQYPAGGGGQPGYQQGTGQVPGHILTTTGSQYPAGPPGYQQGTALTPGQLHTTTGAGGSGQPGYQQGTGLAPGQLHTTTGSQYPGSGGVQTGYAVETTGTTGGDQQGGTSVYGQQPGTYQGTGGQQPGQIYGPQQTGQTGQGQFGQQGSQTFGGGVGDGRNIYQGSIPGTSQVGQYQVTGAGQADDSDTQAQSTIQRADNETQASASSSGRYAGGTAQSLVSGSYAGTGSFSASAGTNDGVRGAQTQVSGNQEGTLSSSQGVGGKAKSQAQVQLSADTGDTTSSAQTGGLNHGTNTQVQSGIKGGMADAQANGPGATSSQAQIGFTPYDATSNDDDPGNPHNGGGTASASSGTHAGKSQVQINGKYAFGIRYTGQAQASSANSGYTADNINLPTMKPLDFSQNTYNKPAKQEKVNVRQIDDPSIIKILTTSTTPPPEEDEEDYEDYEDPNPPPNLTRQNLVQQAKTRSLMHDALDPLEDIDDHGMNIQGQLKHGDIIQTGQFIPGNPGHKIPQGFRGRVSEDNNQQYETTDYDLSKRIIYAAGANANRRGYHEGYGSGYSYQPRYSPVQYGFKSSNQPKNFVSVTKSETGSRNIVTGKKTPSVYYTQSSTCGYFTNTCVYSNGRKICLPKPKANPDGTPIVCRN